MRSSGSQTSAYKTDYTAGVKVFDFFSGCGGASPGFQEAGMEVVFALDWDPDAKRSYIQNFPSVTFEDRDIRQVHVKSVKQVVSQVRPSPVLFCECAPCQPFTNQRTTRPLHGEDSKVPLLLEFLRFVRECKPDIVFVENVPGIQNLSPDMQPLRGFVDGLKEAGFTRLVYDSIPLKQYGVPQGRHRFLLLASRHGILELPPETHGPGTSNLSFSTVKEWIGDLPAIGAGETHPDIPHHRAAILSELNLKPIRATPQGGGNRDWPESLKLNCRKGITGYNDVYGRMSWDRPATERTARCISYSNGRFGHPDQNRAISIREAAHLQTFPNDYVLAGNLNSVARQSNNSVSFRPVPLYGHYVSRHSAK